MRLTCAIRVCNRSAPRLFRHAAVRESCDTLKAMSIGSEFEMRGLIAVDLEAVSSRSASCSEGMTRGWSFRRLELADPLGGPDDVIVRWVANEVVEFLHRLDDSGEVEVCWLSHGLAGRSEAFFSAIGLGGLRAIEVELAQPSFVAPGEEPWFPGLYASNPLEPAVRLMADESARFVWASDTITPGTVEQFATDYGSNGLLVTTGAGRGLQRWDLVEISRFLDVRYSMGLDTVFPMLSSGPGRDVQ